MVATEVTPGAGGTVANNLAALGVGTVAVLGAIGDDGFGWELRPRSGARGIALGSAASAAPAIQTFTYTKLINKSNRRWKTSRASTSSTPRRCPPRSSARFSTACSRPSIAFDVILVSDQAETEPGRRGHARRCATCWPTLRRIIRRRSSGSIRACASGCSERDREAEPAGGGGGLPRAVRTRRLRALRRHVNAKAADGDARRRGRADPRRRRRDVGPGPAGGASGGYLRRGRQLLRGRGHGPARHRVARRGRAVRQPGRVDHDHEEGTGTASPEEVCWRAEQRMTDARDRHRRHQVLDGGVRRRPHGRAANRAPPIAKAGATGCWTRSTPIARAWHAELGFERCGIGFGGPVDFAAQRVALSTHVGGWQDFPLAAHLRDLLGVPVVMDNDANAGALGEAVYGAGAGLRSAVLHDAFHRHRRRHLVAGQRLARRRFLCRRDRPPHHPARRSGVPLRRARLLRTHVLRAVAGARSRQDREGTDRRSGIRAPLRGGSRAGAEGVYHVIEPGADRDWRRHRQSRRCAVRAAARGTAAADHGLVAARASTSCPAQLGDDSVLYGALALAGTKEPI